MNCFSSLHLLDRILLVQMFYTVYMVDGTVIHYHLEIYVLPIVTDKRIYKVLVNLLSGSLLSQNLQALMIQQCFNHIMYELCI